MRSFCDVSVPASVAGVAEQQRPDVEIIRGGVVQLPGREDLGIASFPLSHGQTYACMAEGILLGLEGRLDKDFTGGIEVRASTDHCQLCRTTRFLSWLLVRRPTFTAIWIRRPFRESSLCTGPESGWS